MAQILAVSNQKGGVGKTTTTINVAASLAKEGHKVLIIDLDPQGNASSGVGFPRQDVKMGIYDVIMEYQKFSEVVKSTDVKGLDLIPATRDLVGAEVELVEEDGRERRLRKVLSSAREHYDYILIDCPPSLGLLTVNALVAADAILIPVQAEYFAMEGLSELLVTTSTVRKRLNPDLTRAGIVITMSDGRNRLCQEVEKEIRAIFGAEVFETVIPRNVRLGEAPSFGKPVVDYDPKSRGSIAYRKLAREVMGRIELNSVQLQEVL
jgi:chromosome partitioning protein